ncbi:MAG TPA: hypothetical protein PK322_03960 [Opitutaceae bacterium]|nr:hypothetical protein [Opitutaceae bacterium]
MKFIAESRRPESRKVAVAAGRQLEYDAITDRLGYTVQVGVALWFWSVGIKSDWRAAQ